MQVPLERYGAFANLKYELSADIHFSVKGLRIGGSPRTRLLRCPWVLVRMSARHSGARCDHDDATNIYNPFGVTLVSTNISAFLRRFVEGGPRRFFQTVDTTYGVATLDGHFAALNHDWYWDINGVYGNNKAKQRCSREY